MNKSVYLALGINLQGHKELLGLWIAQTEGAKFWLGVITELQTRGVKDILIACVDGLKGFPEAINTVYPQTHIQLCIVHMVRHAMRLVSWKDYKAVTTDLKAIYQAPTEEAAQSALQEFAKKWITNTQQSPNLGQITGHTSTPFLSTPHRSERPSIRLMPLNHSIHYTPSHQQKEDISQ